MSPIWAGNQINPESYPAQRSLGSTHPSPESKDASARRAHSKLSLSGLQGVPACGRHASSPERKGRQINFDWSKGSLARWK